MEKNAITPKGPWRFRQAAKPTAATEQTSSFTLEEGKGEKRKENKRQDERSRKAKNTE